MSRARILIDTDILSMFAKVDAMDLRLSGTFTKRSRESAGSAVPGQVAGERACGYVAWRDSAAS